MAKSRRANAVLFGFDFQVNAAIVLMLENIEELKTLRLEGNYEDIELELKDGSYILAQAKAIEKSSSDFTNVRKNLKKALHSLSEGSCKINAQQLILITNSPNPLKEDESRSIFWGDAHREFDSLPESSQQIIMEYLKEIKNPLDTDKFMIQILPFETDMDLERYKVVRREVDDFIGKLNINVIGKGTELLRIWHDEIFKNSTKKDVSIKLTKEDILWPLIVIVTDVQRYDDEFEELFDSSLYDEIVFHYKDIINTSCERFEFSIKVLSDYNAYKKGKKSAVKFAKEKWKSYLDEFELDTMDEETKEGLIQIILYSIVRNRLNIDKIKKGANV